MSPLPAVAAVTLLGLAALMIFAATANLEQGEPAYPKGEPRARLLFILVACALTFGAGAVL